MKSHIPLRTRVVALVLAAIVPLFGLSIFKAVLITDAATERANANLSLALSIVAANQQRVVDSAQQVLISVANMPGLLSGNVAECQHYFKVLNDRFAAYTNLGIIGADGYFRCHGVPSANDVFAGDRQYFKDAMASGAFTASGYLVGRATGKSVVTFALPILDDQAKSVAVAFASIDLSMLTQALLDGPLPNGGRLEVTDRQGIVLAVSPAAPGVVGKPVTSRLLASAITDHAKGVMQATDANGIDRIYAYQSVGHRAEAPFFVSLSAERSLVVAPAQRQLLLELLVLALVAFLGGWLAWMLSDGAIVRPTEEILAATRDIQNGSLATRLQTDGAHPDNEFTRLGEGINQMASALQQREQQVASELSRSKQANAELERLQAAGAKSYAELLEAQTKLIEAQRLGRIAYWEWDPENKKIVWSEALHDLTGIARGSFDGRRESFVAMLHPDDRDRYEKLRSRALQARENFDVEYRIVTPAGEVHWIHHLGTLQVDESGEAAYPTGLMQEISARKQAELSLAVSAELVRRTGEMAQIGGWELNLADMQPVWTQQVYLIHGLHPQDKLALDDALGFYAPEAQPIIRAAVQAAIEHGQSWDLELPLITADQRHIWVRAQGKAIVEKGRTVRLVGALQDITTQHAASEQLRLLETCIARLNDIVLITEAQPTSEPGPRIVFVNDAFERRTGYSRSEVLGKTPRILQGPRTQRDELDRIRLALEHGQPVRSELINYTKSGNAFWIELDIVPVVNSAGRNTHWVAVQRDITERKHAEQALKDSEQRYAALFETAPVPMWVFERASGRFLTVNRAAMDSYGYTAEQFKAMTLFDIRPPSEHLKLHAAFSQPQIEVGRYPVADEPWLHKRKDGSVFSASVVTQPIQYQGQPARFAVAFDVSAQVKAEKDVQAYLFTLQRAADAAQAITWHQSLDGTLQEAADQARGVIGASHAEVVLLSGQAIGLNMSVLSLAEKYANDRDDIGALDSSLMHALVCKNNRTVRMTRAQTLVHSELQALLVDRPNHPVACGWLAVPLMGRSGVNIGLLLLSDKFEGEFTLQDEYVALELAQLASAAIENAQLLEQVSQLNAGLEQKVAERTAALARQEALFRALAQQAPQVVWTADNAGRLNYLNRAWFDLMGGSFDDWAGNRWFKAIHPDDLQSVQANWLGAQQTQTQFTGTRRLRAKDGSYHTMTYRASPVLDEVGDVAFWVGIDADITEVKTIEAALRLSNQELEAFSYSVSHDLRSPLNTIDGFSRLLAKQLTADLNEKGAHYLSRIQAGVAQMGKLIEDLLSLAQVSRMQLRLETVDLSAISRQILDEWETRAPDRQVTVRVEPDLLAQADTRLIRVVLENLLGNAWKFTSQKPQATITVGQQINPAGVAVFFVRDDGAGFHMAYADKLFTAFQRLHTVAEFPGTGIGLATVGRVIARHGGELWADATPGQGATFFFTLPVMPASA